MENKVIENYIAANYSKWLRQVRRHCYLRDLKGVVAEDVLQDVMYVLFKKKANNQIVEMILAEVHANTSLLDLYINRAIRHRIFNENKHEIVVNRIIIYGLDLSILKVMDREMIVADFV